MPEEKFVTKLADGSPGRTVSKNKYEKMKNAILSILQASDRSYNDLVTQLEVNLKDNFFDNINWYAQTVILDLEARDIIAKQDKYRIK